MKYRIQNLEAICHGPERGDGMDVVIVSTSCPAQAHYWQQRLEATRGLVCIPEALILVVHEDWTGGAGNALGTLYAYQKAAEQAHKRYAIDLSAAQAAGAAVAIYHTAGKGTRLAPLPGSEANNKSSVKLPSHIHCGQGSYILTMLEAVIRQTSLYASSRKGRLSVFWGDQIFIPTAPLPYEATHAVDILMSPLSKITADIWEKRHLANYGLIAVDGAGHAQQVEKITYADYLLLREKGCISADGGLGISLGSFSLSHVITTALLEEFSDELSKRQQSLDSDPHFWMPLSLDEKTYLLMRERQGENRQWLIQHYQRMQAVKERLETRALLSAVSVGQGSYWWDYGQLKHYCSNILKLCEQGDEAQAMRQFFALDASPSNHSLNIDNCSRLLGCQIGSGRIERSILVGVTADHVDVKDSVIISSSAPKISCEGNLLYNVRDNRPIVMDPHAVRADAFSPKENRHLPFYTHLERDGKHDWAQLLPGNLLSYADLYQLNIAHAP